jgi:shikimate dehydrogenase
MRLGVAGWPVAHSLSPQIQNAALRAVGLEGWRYQLLPIPPALFEETVAALPEAGFGGVNVTIPHKQCALALAAASGGAVTDRARGAGAANTLVFPPDGGEISADNTDAPALTAALAEALPGGLAGISVLVLGAGGSARAAVWALLDAGAAEVRVWNRTPERSRALCDSVEAGTGTGGPARLTPTSVAGSADVLVNCTSVGMAPADPDGLAPLPIEPSLPYRAVVDFVYRAGGTPLIRAAVARGLPVVDGLELLVGQGAISFEQFTGRPAPVAAMRAAAGLGTGPAAGVRGCLSSAR